jgi:hypothetical protein
MEEHVTHGKTLLVIDSVSHFFQYSEELHQTIASCLFFMISSINYQKILISRITKFLKFELYRCPILWKNI